MARGREPRACGKRPAGPARDARADRRRTLRGRSRSSPSPASAGRRNSSPALRGAWRATSSASAASPIITPIEPGSLRRCAARRRAPARWWSRRRRIGCGWRPASASTSRCSMSNYAGATRPRSMRCWRRWSGGSAMADDPARALSRGRQRQPGPIAWRPGSRRSRYGCLGCCRSTGPRPWAARWRGRSARISASPGARASRTCARRCPNLSAAETDSDYPRHVGQSRPRRLRIPAPRENQGVRRRRPRRRARSRQSRAGARRRAAGHPVLRPSRQLGDRRARRRAIRPRHGAGLPRRQQPAHRPHAAPPARRSGRADPEGRGRLAPRGGGAAPRWPSEPPRRPEAERRYCRAVFRPRRR